MPISTAFSSVAPLLESSSGRKVALPAPVLIDEFGREIDGTGRVVQTVTKAPASLKINQKQRTKERIVNPYLAQLEKLKNQDKEVKSRLDRADGLKFRKPGSIIKKAEAMRSNQARQLITEKQKQFNSELSKTDQKPDIILVSDTFVPGLEWWEGPFLELNKRSDFKFAKEFDHDFYSYDDIDVKNWENINLTQHPVPPPCLNPKEVNKSIPLKLTKEERKKKNRIEKMERLREQQELIQVGILPAPEPKLKLSNMTKLFKDDMAANPTMIEKRVRDQMIERQRNHELRNQERKLTSTGKRRKIEQKKIGDITGQKYIAVFKVEDLSDPQHRFKVDVNASQLHIRGRVVLCSPLRCNMIFVEGTEKAINGYIKLLTKRIDWNKVQVDETTNTEEKLQQKNSCYLVWKGECQDIKFDGFKVSKFDTSEEARNSLVSEELTQYWDMVRNYTPIDSDM